MAGETQSQFEQLAAELDTLAKALPADNGEDDEQIQAAAAEGSGMSGDGEPDGDEGKGGKGDGDGDEKPMAKSFEVTLPGGEKAQAVDAGDLIKSLQDQITSMEGGMLKSMNAAMSVIKQQGEMLKSLHEKVQKIGNQGAGRKATVSVAEKPVTTMAKSEPTGMDATEFLAKSEGAFNAGRITGLELSTIETFINRGKQPPADLIARVVQG